MEARGNKKKLSQNRFIRKKFVLLQTLSRGRNSNDLLAQLV